MPLSIQPLGSHETGVCPCCGSISRIVWGAVRDDDVCVAIYHVHWTAEQVARHGANFDLVLAFEGDDTKLEDRCFVALAYRLFSTGPSFMIIDANERSYANGQAGHVLTRNDVIGTEIARAAFAVVDAIWLGDGRISELIQPVH